MQLDKNNLRTCPEGHRFYKTSDCPVCPVCDKEGKPVDGFLSLLAGPARRALEREGIYTLAQLAQYSEKQILQLHGIGPASMPMLRALLADANLSFTNTGSIS